MNYFWGTGMFSDTVPFNNISVIKYSRKKFDIKIEAGRYPFGFKHL